MKSFLFALILSCSVLAAVIGNAVTANRVYDALLDDLDSFPERADPTLAAKAVEELSDRLETSKYYLYLILPQGSLNELMCTCTETLGYLRGQDDASYGASLEKAKLLIKIMKDNEGLRLDNLLFGRADSKKRYFP